MEYNYNNESLNRHNISCSDVNEMLAASNTTTRAFELLLSDSGNLRIMFVGLNFAGRLIEVGVEFIDENKAYVFHGQTVSPKYRKLYQERIANE